MTKHDNGSALLIDRRVESLFKVGYLVVNLPRAMDDFGRWLGVEWTEITTSPLELEAHGHRESVELRYAYSTSGPIHFELIEAQPSGYYSAEAGPQLHHVGRWAVDLAAESARLASEGLACEAFGLDPTREGSKREGSAGDRPALFAFHRGDHGMRIELVDQAMQPSFEAWLAGGELELL